jgi:hypothetical protein
MTNKDREQKRNQMKEKGVIMELQKLRIKAFCSGADKKIINMLSKRIYEELDKIQEEEEKDE